MHSWFSHRPSPAMLVALAALFVALAGTSYAASALAPNSVGTAQLKNAAVTTEKLANRAVTGPKLNLAGVTVPTAVHASTAATAAIGDSPIAWAQVASNGTVTAGRGIASSNITLKGSSAYCFHGLGFKFKSAAVTIDYGTLGQAGYTAGFSVGDPQSDCLSVSGTQAEVATSVGGASPAFVMAPFFIQFFN